MIFIYVCCIYYRQVAALSSGTFLESCDLETEVILRTDCTNRTYEASRGLSATAELLVFK